jgi:hypothetical protein
MAIIKIVNKKYKNIDAIEKLVKYILDPKKRIHNITGAIGTDPGDIDIIIRQFYTVQKMHRNCKGKRICHLVLSFSKEEINTLTIQAFLQIGYAIAEFFNDEYQICFALHEDTDDTHLHFAVNPVNIYSGKKLQWKYQTLYNLILWKDQVVSKALIQQQ